MIAVLDGGARFTRGHRAITVDDHQLICVLDDALQTMLGEHNGEAEVVNQTGYRGEYLLGRTRIECRGRFVEHQDPGVARSAPIRWRLAAARHPRAA